jgi:hypothetical protein
MLPILTEKYSNPYDLQEIGYLKLVISAKEYLEPNVELDFGSWTKAKVLIIFFF